LAVIDIFMQFVSVWTALLLALQIVFQVRRMRNEEVIVGETFPEYAAYKTKGRSAGTRDLLSLLRRSAESIRQWPA